MSSSEAMKQIDDFEECYNYDSTYMRELLHTSPEGFAKFNDFLPLSFHREKLSIEDYWTAKITAMQVEDCGECLQLTIRMALEKGVPKQLIKMIINNSETLSDNLHDLYCYAKAVASHSQLDTSLMTRIKSRYDKAMLLEFGLCIATAKVFPTIKRALAYTKSCSLMDIEV